ncbi:MAG: hypothetical protein ACRECP_02785 [Methylocella sp.]
MTAALLLERGLARRQKAQLGYGRETTPYHATLTGTLRVVDARAMADVLGALCREDNGKAHHVAVAGKTAQV